MIKRFTFFGVVLALLSACTNVSAQVAQAPPPPHTATTSATPFRFGIVNSSLIAEDSRLSKKQVISVSPRIYVTELLEQWKTQTGVSLEARDTLKDDSGRWQITIGLRDAVSLADAMNALRSVLSQQGATWQWERSGTSPNYEYRLIRPLSLEAQQTALKQALQDDFENAVARMKQALSLSDEELKKAAKADNTGVLNRFLEPDGITKQGMATFFNNLNDEQQQGILRGGKRLEVRLNSLDEGGKQYAVGFAKRMKEGIKVNGVQVPYEIPTQIWIDTDSAPSGVIPFLRIWVGNNTQGMTGWDYTRSLAHEAQWRDRVANEVYLRDDSKTPKTEALLTQTITRPEEDASTLSTAQQGWLKKRDLEKSLFELAKADIPHINFMARLPQSGTTDGMGVYGRTVGEVVNELRGRNIIAKWSGDTLLFCNATGFMGSDNTANLLPYSTYRFLSEHLDDWAKAKHVPLEDMLTMVRLSNPEQWQSLLVPNDSYDSVFSFLGRFGLKRGYELLTALAEYPDVAQRMTSKEGFPLGELPTPIADALSRKEGMASTGNVIYRPITEKGITFGTWYLKQRTDTVETYLPQFLQISYRPPLSWKEIVEKKTP